MTERSKGTKPKVERTTTRKATPSKTASVTLETFAPLTQASRNAIGEGLNTVLNLLYSKKWHEVIHTAPEEVRNKAASEASIPRKVFALIASYETHTEWAEAGQAAWRTAKADPKSGGANFKPSWKPFADLAKKRLGEHPVDQIGRFEGAVARFIAVIDKGELPPADEQRLLTIVNKLAVRLAADIKRLEQGTSSKPRAGAAKRPLASVPADAKAAAAEQASA